MRQKLYTVLAQTIYGYQGNKDNAERKAFFDANLDNLFQLEKEFLPSGSGIDAGCRVNMTESTSEKIVIDFSFHHLNANGYYDGWTDHKIIIKASLMFGIDMKITGRDKNGIKEYLYDVFSTTLNQTVEYNAEIKKYLYSENLNK